MTPAQEAWYRYDHGVGPLPRVPRPEAALGETAVCGTCGAVYRVDRGHVCGTAAMSGDFERWQAAEMAAEILGQYFTDPGDLADAVAAIEQDAEESGGPVISVVIDPDPGEPAERWADFERRMRRQP